MSLRIDAARQSETATFSQQAGVPLEKLTERAEKLETIRARMTAIERQIDDENLSKAVKPHLRSEANALRQLSEERSAYTALLLSIYLDYPKDY